VPTSDASSAPSTPRASRTLTGWTLRGVFWLGCLSVVAIAVIVGSGWRPWRAAPVVVTPRKPVSNGAVGDPLASAARQAARSVVSIQTIGPGNTRNLGAGFLVEDRLVATNFHVMSAATEAQVRFADGRVFAIAGYAAADREHDLALLRLSAPPVDVTALPLADDDVPLATKVMAIGHPRGVEFAFVEGRISQRIATGDLPSDGQRFVRKLTGAGDGLRWLQHSASLAEGNSGGPLIDEGGRVVGINTWINRQAATNYALDGRYLRELLDQATNTTRPLDALARPDVQASALIARMTAQRVETLFTEAERIGWLPATTADYRQLSELALAMTAAHLPQNFRGDKRDQARAHELQTAVVKLEERLRVKKHFGSPDQITIVNEQATLVVDRAHTGVFCFIEVERTVEGERGQRGMLVHLIGSERPLFISLDGQFLQPQPGQTFALFGANFSGEVVRYGDNPLKLITAPVIVSRTFIPVE
jgi:S1-C subfamily serine protease